MILGLAKGEKDEDEVRFALGPVSIGVAFATWMSAVGTARMGLQLERPRNSIRDVVELC